LAERQLVYKNNLGLFNCLSCTGFDDIIIIIIIICYHLYVGYLQLHA